MAERAESGPRRSRCSTCHMTSTQPNEPAPAPLRAGIDWQLAPVEFIWFGKSGAEICAQLKDPKRNGGRDAVGSARTSAARCIAQRLHPAGVGARRGPQRRRRGPSRITSRTWRCGAPRDSPARIDGGGPAQPGAQWKTTRQCEPVHICPTPRQLRSNPPGISGAWLKRQPPGHRISSPAVFFWPHETISRA